MRPIIEIRLKPAEMTFARAAVEKNIKNVVENKNKPKNISFFVLALLSACLLVLSFPNFELSGLAGFSLVPLFFIIKDSSPSRTLFFSYITGMIFFAGALSWLAHVTRLGYVVLTLYLSLFFGSFGILSKIFCGKFENSRLSFLLCLIIPSLWVVLEFLRGWLFTGFPWALLGYTQYKNPLFIQIAGITGAYGVSFLIVMANMVLFLWLSASMDKGYRKWPLSESAAFCVIFILCAAYGYFSLNMAAAPGLKIAVAQASIEQSKKWDPVYKDYILDTYEELTKKAAESQPDLIVWPETAIPGFMDERDINLRLIGLMDRSNIPLFSGAVTYKRKDGEDYFFNSALLFSADGVLRRQYNKTHLVPFGEYIPFEAKIPFLRNAIDKDIGNYTKGDEFTIFEITGQGEKPYKYAALICFEDTFPALARRFAKNGADFLINITNDAWFGESSEQLQHAQASVFRAVENRISVIRAANNGFSCYISPKGVIEDYVCDGDVKNIYKKGSKAFSVDVEKGRSFYTFYGDVFACVCFILLAVCFLKQRG